jgi:hypothetical protein
MRSKAEYRVATPEDLKSFYKDDPVYYTTRAVVIIKRKRVVGVAGVCRVDNKHVVFTTIKKGRVTKRDVLEAAKLFVPILDRYPSVIAFVDEKIETSLSFGAHFGFELTGQKTTDGRILMRVSKKWNR